MQRAACSSCQRSGRRRAGLRARDGSFLASSSRRSIWALLPRDTHAAGPCLAPNLAPRTSVNSLFSILSPDSCPATDSAGPPTVLSVCRASIWYPMMAAGASAAAAAAVAAQRGRKRPMCYSRLHAACSDCQQQSAEPGCLQLDWCRPAAGWRAVQAQAQRTRHGRRGEAAAAARAARRRAAIRCIDMTSCAVSNVLVLCFTARLHITL